MKKQELFGKLSSALHEKKISCATGFLAGFAALAALVPVPVLATPVVDQLYNAKSNVTEKFSNPNDPTFRRAETFTVGITGTLDMIGVNSYFPIPNTISGINILETSGGVPTKSIIDVGSYTKTENYIAYFTVSVPVVAGEVLAMEPLSTNGGTWFAVMPNSYSGGGDYYLNTKFGVNNFTYSYAGDDFVTYVDPATSTPEPASVTLLGSALLAFGFILYRRRRAAKSLL